VTGRRWSTRKIAVTIVGSLLLIAGVAALVLPGPGLLLLMAGLVVLATEFEWAARRVDSVRDKAFDVSAASVATRPRIVFSTVSACLVVAAGVFWWVDPEIPTFWIIGPDLPFGGPATGLVVVVSGLVALGLIAYSLQRFRWGPAEPPGSRSG
jgi:hypothetical protein